MLFRELVSVVEKALIHAWWSLDDGGGCVIWGNMDVHPSALCQGMAGVPLSLSRGFAGSSRADGLQR